SATVTKHRTWCISITSTPTRPTGSTYCVFEYAMANRRCPSCTVRRICETQRWLSVSVNLRETRAQHIDPLREKPWIETLDVLARRRPERKCSPSCFVRVPHREG